MTARSVPRWLMAALLLCVATSATAVPLVSMPEPSSGDLRFGADAIPNEIRDSIAQDKVATLSERILLGQSERLRAEVTKHPEDPYPLHALGTVTFHLGGDKEAEALWRAAAKREPNLAPADLMRDVQTVFRLLAKGENNAAQVQLQRLDTRHAAQPHFHLIRAEQAMRGRNFDEAERAFRKAYELAPQLYVSSLNLARFLDFSARDRAGALRLYEESARKAPARVEVWHYLGRAQLGNGDEQAALASFRRLASLAPQEALAERRIATLKLEAGDLPGAERWYRRALQARPGAAESAEINAALGDVLLRQGNTVAARAAIEAALKHAESLPLVFALATLDEADGRNAAAERGYRRVLEASPGNPLAANNLAMLLIRNRRAGDEALRLAEGARTAVPGNAIIESTYGCALSDAGRNLEAITVLEAVVKARPTDSWAEYCLGRSQIENGLKAEAGVHLGRVLELDSHFPRRDEVRKMLGTAH